MFISGHVPRCRKSGRGCATQVMCASDGVCLGIARGPDVEGPVVGTGGAGDGGGREDSREGSGGQSARMTWGQGCVAGGCVRKRRRSSKKRSFLFQIHFFFQFQIRFDAPKMMPLTALRKQKANEGRKNEGKPQKSMKMNQNSYKYTRKAASVQSPKI